MTPKQRRLYDFIGGYIEVFGYPPSYQQMQTHMGLKSKSQVHALVTRLEKQGKIRRIPHLARSIEIVAIAESLPEIEHKARKLSQAAERLNARFTWALVENPAMARPETEDDGFTTVYGL